MCNCTDPPCGEWSPDCEESPRNACAIRTAIMLGAEFERVPPIARRHSNTPQWRVKGISAWSDRKTSPAWLFLSCHGIGISNDDDPRPIKMHMNIGPRDGEDDNGPR